MNNYENLIREKETLENRLAIITKEIQTFEKVACKEKSEKIIALMDELIPLIGDEIIDKELEGINDNGEWEMINYSNFVIYLKNFFIKTF